MAYGSTRVVVTVVVVCVIVLALVFIIDHIKGVMDHRQVRERFEGGIIDIVSGKANKDIKGNVENIQLQVTNIVDNLNNAVATKDQVQNAKKDVLTSVQSALTTTNKGVKGFGELLEDSTRHFGDVTDSLGRDIQAAKGRVQNMDEANARAHAMILRTFEEQREQNDASMGGLGHAIENVNKVAAADVSKLSESTADRFNNLRKVHDEDMNKIRGELDLGMKATSNKVDDRLRQEVSGINSVVTGVQNGLLQTVAAVGAVANQVENQYMQFNRLQSTTLGAVERVDTMGRELSNNTYLTATNSAMLGTLGQTVLKIGASNTVMSGQIEALRTAQGAPVMNVTNVNSANVSVSTGLKIGGAPYQSEFSVANNKDMNIKLVKPPLKTDMARMTIADGDGNVRYTYAADGTMTTINVAASNITGSNITTPGCFKHPTDDSKGTMCYTNDGLVLTGATVGGVKQVGVDGRLKIGNAVVDGATPGELASMTTSGTMGGFRGANLTVSGAVTAPVIQSVSNTTSSVATPGTFTANRLVASDNVTATNSMKTKDMTMTGKLNFDVSGSDNSDPYSLEKVVTAGNVSHLRLALNDDCGRDGIAESMQLWCGNVPRIKMWSDGSIDASAINTSGDVNVGGNLNALNGTPNIKNIRFSSNWTGYPDDKTDGAEISNDTNHYKTLMIVGNRSGGQGRKVSVWDRLEVNGNTLNNGKVGVGIDPDSMGDFNHWVEKPTGGWQGLYRNGGPGGQHVYLNHGGGYGMHINTNNGSGERYAMQMYAGGRELMTMYNDGRMNLNGSLTSGSINAHHVHSRTGMNIENEGASLNLWKRNDGNRGITLEVGPGGADGVSGGEYNGGLASWYGIGFRCKTDGGVRHMFNTRNGDMSAAGTIRAGNAICIGGTCINEDHLKLLTGQRPMAMRSVETGKHIEQGGGASQGDVVKAYPWWGGHNNKRWYLKDGYYTE